MDMHTTYPIPLSEPAPVITHTLPLRRAPRGEVWRWFLTLSSLARVRLRNSSLADMVVDVQERLGTRKAGEIRNMARLECRSRAIQDEKRAGDGRERVTLSHSRRVDRRL